MQEICSLNKLVSSLDEKNAWGNDACFAESAAWDPLQRLRSLEFPSSTHDSCRSTISLSIALCKSHAKAMSGGLGTSGDS